MDEGAQSVMHGIRRHLTFANAMATIAVFVAVGGTSYAAITLPRNSVGERQIKAKAVGAAELKANSVGSRAIKNASIRPRDLAAATKEVLVGRPGPAGPAGPPAVELRAAVNSAGTLVDGNATLVTNRAVGLHVVDFSRSLAECVPVATLALSPGDPVNPGAGSIVLALEGDRVSVRTYDPSGTPASLPFNLIVAC
jgi:hypothetical protein